MDKQRINVFSVCLGMAALNFVGPSGAAEIRGLVRTHSPAVLQAQEVAVEVYPLEGQVMPEAVAGNHRIVIDGQRLLPVYLLAQPGDTLEFENRDKQYYQLFSPFSGYAFEATLAPFGAKDRARLHLGQTGSLHLFDRIHQSVYGRVDVIDTPYHQMVKPGQQFEFSQLQPGRWRLHVSAPAVEPLDLDVQAMTAPPLITISVKSRVVDHALPAGMPEPVVVEQLFPARARR